jgi:hypothetical protein
MANGGLSPTIYWPLEPSPSGVGPLQHHRGTHIAEVGPTSLSPHTAPSQWMYLGSAAAAVPTGEMVVKRVLGAVGMPRQYGTHVVSTLAPMHM